MTIEQFEQPVSAAGLTMAVAIAGRRGMGGFNSEVQRLTRP
jgi:hypothetical protein